MRTILALLTLLVVSTASWALSLGDFTNQEASGGLKEALSQGVDAAVKSLGKTDGFLKNKKVKIPLPSALEKGEKMMRMAGMGKQADELVTAMNRAAEAAVPEATALLSDAVKSMSVEDAKKILTGGEGSVTAFFKEKTQAQLTEKFLPIVKEQTAKVNLAQMYDQYAGQGAKLGLVKKEDAQIDNYVTRKALDGLYTMIGEEEKAIRANPVGAVGGLAKKVFGALGR
ncbi:MAG TPA: DUF4197 domain-containing protein [Rhodocyclaceae bacterium]|nr:DUF4197 domain-containing protein [Rhodocyclaceae bacterium]HMZ82830.1 DUF4197 domain-containing protein [Rhodocyclaceae bacterium]HNA04852.1 DUF4197 domain-containing protein [Rhodocyclaceae bacterium]HNB79886.1 DUF4197 domain-containing protein [Rhodocyclaceae bacterium]HNC62536.1 DUF4197 domain-containing protein [Rhodocyclaceae bacterium]